jgi:hypothetical protein
MPIKTVAIVGAGLVAVGAVAVVEALFRLGGDARCATAADVARMIVGAEGCCHIGVANDGTASMRSAGLSGLSGAVVELFAASTDVRLIEEALQRALLRAEVFTAAGFAAGFSVTTTFFRAIRAKNYGVLITILRRRTTVRCRPKVQRPSVGTSSIRSGVG